MLRSSRRGGAGRNKLPYNIARRHLRGGDTEAKFGRVLQPLLGDVTTSSCICVALAGRTRAIDLVCDNERLD